MNTAHVAIIHVEPQPPSPEPDTSSSEVIEMFMPGSVNSDTIEQGLTTETGILADASGLDLHLVNRALVNFLATGSPSAERVRALFRDEHAHHDVTLLRLLAAVVAEALPGAQPSVCMHAHGINVPLDDGIHLHPADGGPSFHFSVIDDLNLVESARFYETGLMIQPENYRIVRRYPYSVKFYVIVDGVYRGVRLCSLSVIESLGFSPLEPSGDDPFPACRGFWTAEEAFHYLYRALHDRGILCIIQLGSDQGSPTPPVGNLNPFLEPENEAFANYREEADVAAQL